MQHETVIVLDFGGQYNQLIARRVRENNVYCEIYSYKTDLSVIKAKNPKGIIFTGGPGVQAQHAVGHGIAGRQHDDRHLHAVFPAQGAAQADAVQAGEHDVQHHQVELAGRRHLEARTAVAGAIQFIAQGLQIGVQVGEDVLVIFHQQDRDRHHAHLRKKGRGAVRPLKDGKTGGRTAVKKAPQGRNITG